MIITRFLSERNEERGQSLNLDINTETHFAVIDIDKMSRFKT